MLRTNCLKMRDQVVGLDTTVKLANGNQKTTINLDNAATTPPFRSVLNAVNDFAPWYGTVHRGGGYKSDLTTRLYEEARCKVADFVGADFNEQVVIFVKNTTEAINKLAYRLAQGAGRKNIVISSVMEHHSNDLPWRGKFHVLRAEVDEAGRLRLDDLESKLRHSRGKVRLVTVTGASNVTGHVNPVYQIARLAHRYGAEIMVDGAQMVPHMPISMSAPGVEPLDYLAFSGHKMYAPFGCGVLIGPRRTFEAGHSELVGGGTVELVSCKNVRWAGVPERDEAGTPNIMGVVALTEAVRVLTQLNMRKIMIEEQKLAAYARSRLSKIPRIKMYGDQLNHDNKVGIISFNIEGVPHEEAAAFLADYYGIAVRSGCFCAQPYIQRLLCVSTREVERSFTSPSLPHRGMVRVSFGLYNTKEEVDTLVDAVNELTCRADPHSILSAGSI